jgi:hypothetical protein
MPYLGKEPARVPFAAEDIPNDSITAAKIVDGAITIADIADDAVTEDKLANAINTAIAANTAKTGITTSQANAITANTAKVTNATHTGEVTGSGALTIANDAVTTVKILDDNVTAAKLANSINSEITANTAKVTNATHTGDVTGATALTIAADAITGAKIADDAVESEHIAAGAVDDAHIVGLTSSKLSGALPAIDGSALTGVATDLTSIRNDIATLALHSAVADNKAAYNLPSSFIDQFQDDTGIGTETDGDRDDSEYWGTISIGAAAAFSNDSNTEILLHMDDTGLTDSSSNSKTITRHGGAAKTSSQVKLGTHSAYFDGSGDYLTTNNDSIYDFSTTDFTVECWIYQKGSANYDGICTFQASSGSASFGYGLGYNASNRITWVRDLGSVTEVVTYDSALSDNTWHHIAVSRSSGVTKLFINGTEEDSATDTWNYQAEEKNGITLSIGRYYPTVDEKYFYGGIDELRISDNARYTANFTPNSTITVGATGTLISTAQTANAAQTKVSGVILYKNEDGTATLGTDLKVYFTCNGGTNWTESTPAAAGTFSSGILMAKCPEVTCTSGTDVRYKVVWANQAVGSKETQLHGIAMNY